MEGPMSRQVERQATRMSEMMERLDVDALTLVRLGQGTAYAEARDKCLRCRNFNECLLWLDATPMSVEAPLFCPNHALFEACVKTKAR